MAEETIYAFLERRERELEQQIAALQGQLEPKQAELAALRRSKNALNIGSGNALSGGVNLGNINALAAPFALSPDSPSNGLGMLGNPPPSNTLAAAPYAGWTIKQMVVQAFLDHFRRGATSQQLREFIHVAYGRPIDPSSLRPQMHRLKGAGGLEHDSSTDKWNLTKDARAKYTMYNHPSSRAAMEELKDDPIPPNESLRR